MKYWGMSYGRPTRTAALATVLLLAGATRLAAWSWQAADAQAPPDNLFAQRGQVEVVMGAGYAAPGAPASHAALYGVIRYRDDVDASRSYDLFFSPALAVWKFLRWEPGMTASARYVGGFHYDNCSDGFVTATDRVFMPAMGATTGVECGSPVTSVRTNYGCMNSHFSNPFPLDNYQGAGSGSGDQPDMVVPPTWNPATRSLFSATLSKPWIWYEGILDPNSPRFLQDFLFCANRSFIQQQAAQAERNVRLENQIRVYPDGTVMLTHIWSDLRGRSWIDNATDGYWLAPDSAPAGRVFYYDPAQSAYIEPFAGGQNPAGLYLTTGNGWVGYFIDTLRPDVGMGFYYYVPAGIGIFAANNWPNSPAVVHTDFFTSIVRRGQAFRQMFILLGTREQMQARNAVLQPYVKVLSLPPPARETYCFDGIDDDNDGRIDCADADCSRIGCPELCADGLDNDADGDVDCDDTDCQASADCPTPDLDGDGDVDLDDFGRFQVCLTGPFGMSIAPGCEQADLDSDDQVDQMDVLLFQGCLGGAGVPLDDTCW